MQTNRSTGLCAVLLFSSTLALPLPLSAQSEVISVTFDGSPPTGSSYGPAAVSSDGRFVAFVSSAENLVPNDTNGEHDVFVRDRLMGTTTRVSVASDGTQGDGRSGSLNHGAGFVADLDISWDGRYVVFSSGASNLVADDGTERDVFMHDRETGETTQLSLRIDATGTYRGGELVSMSGDAFYVAFISASPLDATIMEDTPIGVMDQYLWRNGRAITLLNRLPDNRRAGGGNETDPMELETGDSIYFITNRGLGDGTEGGLYEIRLPIGGGTGPLNAPTLIGADYSTPSVCAGSGFEHLAFTSSVSTLVPDDTNATSDVFLRDPRGPTITRLSVQNDGLEGSPHPSTYPSLSGYCAFAAFSSEAELVEGAGRNMDRNAIYVHERDTATTRLVSARLDGSAGWGDRPRLSFDASVVTFVSNDPELLEGGSTRGTIYAVAPFPEADLSLNFFPTSNSFDGVEDFTVSVYNRGPFAARDLELQVVVADPDHVPLTVPDECVSTEANEYTCFFGLEALRDNTAQFRLRVTYDGDHERFARVVSATVPDPDLFNNESRQSQHVTGTGGMLPTMMASGGCTASPVGRAFGGWPLAAVAVLGLTLRRRR